MQRTQGIKIIASNKKAFFNYFLEDFLETGLVLTGTEIKSLRKNGCDLSDAYILIRNNEAFIMNMHIALYDKGTIYNHEPRRTRKLLMHKIEIRKYEKKSIEKGYTIIPSKVYLYKGKAKVEIALGKGKKLYDKRETIKKRDDERKMAKAIKGHYE